MPDEAIFLDSLFILLRSKYKSGNMVLFFTMHNIVLETEKKKDNLHKSSIGAYCVARETQLPCFGFFLKF